MRLTNHEKLELIADAIISHIPLAPETTLDELDFDSLDAASVAAMAIENADSGAVEVDELTIARCRTVGELVKLVWPRG